MYNSQLWEPVKTFEYTGAPEEFTLSSGTYLFVANGARGGNSPSNAFRSWGGTTYGILDLDHQQTFYAVVGGNGSDGTTGERPLGGYNGGGNGGLSNNTSTYPNGAAGGGASDVRLLGEDIVGIHTVPEGYDQVEYIESNQTQYFDTGYYPTATARIECVAMAYNVRSSRETLFAASSQLALYTWWDGNYYDAGAFDINGYGYYWWTDQHASVFGVKIKYVVNNNTLYMYDSTGTETYSYTHNYSRVNCSVPLTILERVNSGSPANWKLKARLYSFKIYESDTLVHWYVPFVSQTDSNDSGLYDLVTGIFLRSTVGDPFVCGDPVQKDEYPTVLTSSLMTRIIVAGGGGGTGHMTDNDNYQDFLSFGGGPMSGWVVCGNGTYENNDIWRAAEQSSGNAFGIGRNAEDRVYTNTGTWCAEGQGGGGGGWYGGYAAKGVPYSNYSYTSCNGSGGSSYVLTDSSYKPTGYMTGYEDIMPSLYFRNGLMLPGQAFEGPSIVIYKPMHTPPLMEDTIRVPYTGTWQSALLIPGTYKIKCYGGDGATRFRNTRAAKGGYAEGILNLTSNDPLYYHVGSSSYLVGMATSAASHDTIFNNKMIYQAAVGDYSEYRLASMAGGGSVDVRTVCIEDSAEDSKLSRIIVAGGGGGMGHAGTTGGNGGGLEGGWYNGSYGTNNGPGTQSSGNAFETGGLGSAQNSGYGGSGGYGWYGGCGTTPDGSADDDRSGCGGSGYVLTSTSTKPSGYIPDESYWMTDTVLTAGGNPVRGISRIDIDVINVSTTYIIAHDDAGYKGYDVNTDTWINIPVSSLTPDVFNEYGVNAGVIKSDVGLLFPYNYYIYDAYNIGIDYISSYVIPNTQHIQFSKISNAEILDYVFDYDKDDTTTIGLSYSISGVAETRAINIDIEVTMDDIPSTLPILYMVQFSIQTRQTTYYYPEKPEKTIDELKLLHVGTTQDVPSRYKTHIGGFMPDGTTPITSVISSSSCEYKRNIYTVSLINGTHLRFTRFNIMENKSYVIRDDIPISGLSVFANQWCGGSLSVNDDTMYLYHSANYDNNGYWEWMYVLAVPLDPTKSHTVYSSTDKRMNCYGKTYWYSSKDIISCSAAGFILFDTARKTFTEYQDTNTNGGRRTDFAMGDYSLMSIWHDSTATGPRLYDRATLTRYPDSSDLDNNMEQGIKCMCYGDGNFYITTKGHLYVVPDREDHALVIGQDILTPYSTLQPKTINYGNGILYITFADNKPVVYAYNITANQWFYIALPFNTKNFDNINWIRPACFNSFFFIGNLKLFVTNANSPIKYNVGEKRNVDMILLNNSYQGEIIHDERFVTIDDNGIKIHPGNIVKQLTLIDSTNNIYSSESYTDNEYHKLINVITGKEEDDIDG